MRSRIYIPPCDGKTFKYHLAQNDMHLKSTVIAAPVPKMASKIKMSMNTGIVTNQKPTIQRPIFSDQRDYPKIK